MNQVMQSMVYSRCNQPDQDEAARYTAEAVRPGPSGGLAVTVDGR